MNLVRPLLFLLALGLFAMQFGGGQFGRRSYDYYSADPTYLRSFIGAGCSTLRPGAAAAFASLAAVGPGIIPRPTTIA